MRQNLLVHENYPHGKGSVLNAPKKSPIPELAEGKNLQELGNLTLQKGPTLSCRFLDWTNPPSVRNQVLCSILKRQNGTSFFPQRRLLAR
jgi:hypothetical protein